MKLSKCRQDREVISNTKRNCWLVRRVFKVYLSDSAVGSVTTKVYPGSCKVVVLYIMIYGWTAYCNIFL